MIDILAMKATYGFVGATASGGVSWLLHKGMLAEVVPEDMNWIVEGSAWLTLVGCLIYAVRSLWAANNELRRENREIMAAQAKRDEETIERMAEALETFNERAYGNGKN